MTMIEYLELSQKVKNDPSVHYVRKCSRNIIQGNS